MDIKQLRLGNIIDIYTNENSEVAEVFELHEKSFQAEQPNYMVGGVEYDGNSEPYKREFEDENLRELGFVKDEITIQHEGEIYEIWRLGDFSVASHDSSNKFIFNDDETAKALGLPLKMPIVAFQHLQNLYY